MTEHTHHRATRFVDVQNGLPPGRLSGVAAPTARRHPPAAAEEAGTLVATCDCHPAGHVSFRDRGGLWPSHCVEGTTGAEPHVFGGRPALRHRPGQGAVTPTAEQYNFRLRRYRPGRPSRAAAASAACWWRAWQPTTACGRPRWTRLRPASSTSVLVDAVAAVDVEPGDGERALREIRPAGGLLHCARCCVGANNSSPHSRREGAPSCARWWRGAGPQPRHHRPVRRHRLRSFAAIAARAPRPRT